MGGATLVAQVPAVLALTSGASLYFGTLNSSVASFHVWTYIFLANLEKSGGGECFVPAVCHLSLF